MIFNLRTPKRQMAARDQQGSKYPRINGFNELQVPARLDLQAAWCKVDKEGHRIAPSKPITSNSVILLSALAFLLTLVVLLDLHIRAGENHSSLRQQHIDELNAQIAGADPATTLALDAVSNVELLRPAE